MKLSIEESNKLSQLYTEKVLVEMDIDGVMGGSPTTDDLENQDDYAPGDSRIPKLIGNVITRKGPIPLKKRKKSRRSRPL